MATTGARPREATPPPVIGKAGRYTVFITPPATPRDQADSPKRIPKISTPPPTCPPPAKLTPVKAPPPPVQVPPLQFDKPGLKGSGSAFGFFWEAVAKVQEAHSSLDEYLADWLGLNQSKYQWALNDYYVNSTGDKEGGKQKDLPTKGQAV